MTEVSLEYKRKIWLFLDNIKPGVTYTVNKLVKAENKEAFIDAVKEFMRSLPNEGYIRFKGDSYEQFYRIEHNIKLNQ